MASFTLKMDQPKLVSVLLDSEGLCSGIIQKAHEFCFFTEPPAFNLSVVYISRSCLDGYHNDRLFFDGPFPFDGPGAHQGLLPLGRCDSSLCCRKFDDPPKRVDEQPSRLAVFSALLFLLFSLALLIAMSFKWCLRNRSKLVVVDYGTFGGDC